MAVTNLVPQILAQMMSWRVVLDIVLIGIGLFLIYRTLRTLGTWRIMAGLLVAIAFFAAAEVLNLRGIIWIYTNLTHVAIIALIVIFQPELRKMFAVAAALGRRGWRRGDSKLAVMISQAVFRLAEQKRGAILVFPGREPITEWLSGGFVLDAEPSAPLILSLYDPNSPGHDGAILIQNGKISSFAIRLPLSKTQTVPEELGTRHHAAMGLSEVSDALLVAVSEERGSVTVFHRGKMRAVQDTDALTSRIVSHWREAASPSLTSLKKSRKWGLVRELSISLSLAFLFWFTVIFAQAEMLERVFSVPIEFVAAPEHIAIVGDKPTEIKALLSGPKAELNGINSSQLAFRIDLSKMVPGKHTFVVTESNLQLPKRVKLLDADPSTFVLSFREIREKVVTVKPQLIGKLPEGLQIVAVSVNPQKIRILAPPGDSKTKETSVMVTTTPIYLENIREDTTIFCKIIAPPAIQPVDKGWPDVEVAITVKGKER
jgi:diadenylate cyclase